MNKKQRHFEYHDDQICSRFVGFENGDTNRPMKVQIRIQQNALASMPKGSPQYSIFIVHLDDNLSFAIAGYVGYAGRWECALEQAELLARQIGILK